MNLAVQGGWATVAEARQSVGLPTTTEQDVYLLPAEKVSAPANSAQRLSTCTVNTTRRTNR